MISEKWHARIRQAVQVIEKFADRLWYPEFLGVLSFLDTFIIILPNDGILISSSMLVPKRWFSLGLWVGIGSALGGMALAALVRVHGMPWILEIFPNLTDSKAWTVSLRFFEDYGLLLVFLVALMPVMQHPALILVALSQTAFTKIALVVFAGRLIKYLVLAYVGSHMPRLVKKMWGFKEELKDAGIAVDEP